jgi:hypothetical protein
MAFTTYFTSISPAALGGSCGPPNQRKRSLLPSPSTQSGTPCCRAGGSKQEPFARRRGRSAVSGTPSSTSLENWRGSGGATVPAFQIPNTMANQLLQRIEPGEDVVVLSRYTGGTLPAAARTFRFSHGAGMHPLEEGTGILGSWVTTGRQHRIESYMLDAESRWCS